MTDTTAGGGSPPPTTFVVEQHQGIYVVRDDLYPGGTKARIFSLFYDQYDEVIYACSALSWSQVSLSMTARRLSKKATIFCGLRKERTQQTQRAASYGADIHEVKPGYLSVVHARAESYMNGRGRFWGGHSYLAPLGFDTPTVIASLASAASRIALKPDEIWVASGSGVLSRSLQKAFPTARHYAIQVGKVSNTGKATVFKYPKPFDYECQTEPPFPCERNYDREAWELCREYHGKGAILFWDAVGEP